MNIQIPLVTFMPLYKAQDLKVLSQLFSPEIPCVELICTRCMFLVVGMFILDIKLLRYSVLL